MALWYLTGSNENKPYQPPKSKTVAYKAYFAANSEFSTKPEKVFNLFF